MLSLPYHVQLEVQASKPYLKAVRKATGATGDKVRGGRTRGTRLCCSGSGVLRWACAAGVVAGCLGLIGLKVLSCAREAQGFVRSRVLLQLRLLLPRSQSTPPPADSLPLYSI